MSFWSGRIRINENYKEPQQHRKTEEWMNQEEEEDEKKGGLECLQQIFPLFAFSRPRTRRGGVGGSGAVTKPPAR